MSINVYWACLEDHWMIAEQPESVSKIFYKKNMFDKNNPLSCLNYCPAFSDNLKNLYAIKSIYNYEFFIKDDKVVSSDYDQKFFDEHVLIRDKNLRLFSYQQKFIFFTEKESLPTTFYEFPFLENNYITERCMIIPGKYDIGKWFRNLDFAFYLKNNFDSFKVEQGEIVYYIRFHTKEKINFIQFKDSKKLEEYRKDGFMLNSFAKFNNLQEYYNKFKLKNLILKEIKKNIL
jgi:hypothetical protein